MGQASDSLLAMVAKLYYLEQLPQDEVARIVRLSQSKVSRLLSLARKRGVVHISVDDSYLRNRELESQLAERFGLRQVIVVASIEGPHPETVTGHGCAQVSDLTHTLGSHATIGVTGGRTLSQVVRALRRRPSAKAERVVPLMGHFGPQVSPVDAVDLCRILARKLGAEPFVINAPAYAADAGSRQLFMSHADIQAVWRMFAQMDVALVGIGVVEDSVTGERGLLQPWDAQAIQAQGAVGEVAGRFFDCDGCECPTDFRDRVIGIELDALRRIPEVIGVTHGANRGEAVRAAIRGGLLKSLVIDEEGALAMLDHDPRPAGDSVESWESVDIPTQEAGGTRRVDRAKGPTRTGRRSTESGVRRMKNRARRVRKI